MHAVQVDTGGEQVRGARQTERRQVPAVGAAPESDVRPVYLRPPPQIQAGSGDVAILGGALGSEVDGFAEFHAVADSAAIVHGQDDEAPAREVLVHRIGVAVVVHVMPAGQHLTPRSAVEEDDGGPPLSRLRVRGPEELGVDRQAVRGREDHGLGDDERGGREVRRGGAGSQILVGAASDANGRGGVLLRARAHERDGLAVAGCDRRPLETGAGGQRDGPASRHRNAPEVAPVDVVLVRAVEDGLAVG